MFFSTLPELDLSRFGLSNSDTFNFENLIHSTELIETIQDAKNFLQFTYCGTVGAEFSYIESEHEREWLCKNYETILNTQLSANMKKEIAHVLLKSQTFDYFMAVKFPTYKRYGGEGAESMMAFFRQLFNSAVENDINNLVMGISHRGKINLMTTMLNMRPIKIFNKIKGFSEFPKNIKAMGDIPSHFRKYNNYTV